MGSSPRRIGRWTLVTHTLFEPGHQLATPALDAWHGPSIVVSEGRALDAGVRWPSGMKRIAILREVIETDRGPVVLEDIGLSTSLVAFPPVLPLGMAWTLGASIAEALADVHDAGRVLGGLIPSMVFVDGDREVTFAPRVLAFRPASDRTRTPEADVAALLALLRVRVAAGDREAFEAATRGRPGARSIAECLGEQGGGASREALRAWLEVDRASASLARRVQWVWGVSKAPEETVIAACDAIAARLGSSDRVVVERPDRGNADFFLDSEVGWEMQRGGRSASAKSDAPAAVRSLLAKLERIDAEALERCCATLLIERLTGLPTTLKRRGDEQPFASRQLQCPSCGSTSVTFLESWEITEVACPACGRRECIDLHQLEEWYSH